METNAPILFRLVERKVKVIEFDFVVVLVENPTADVGWMMRMIRTPVISAVEKTTDADPEGILQTTFTVRNSFVQQSHAAVQA